MITSPTGRAARRASRYAALGLAAAAALSLAACSSGASGTDSTDAASTDSASDYVWTMVTDQAGLGDKGFNDLAKLGLDQSVEELGGKAQVLQSTDQAQYVTNLQQAVTSGSTVTTGVGFLLTDALVEVAQANPDAMFTLIDAIATDEDGEPLPNVASVTFKEQEASFLTGIVAGLTTETDSIGFVGGLEIPAVLRFYSGFAAGVASVNPDATVTPAYVGSFADAAKAKELALGFYDQGSDIVMDVAGGGGLGIFDAAKELGDGHWVVSTDTCKVDLAPDNFLTSAVKDVAGSVLRENTAAADGTFEGGSVELGLSDDGVGLCQDNIDTIPADILEKVDAATTAITSGEIVPPATPEELETFEAPSL
ncbi:BMP family ABC transporter substrate-binding protein [Herbiconiux moechotypicola]|uniref:BMP family ABC transporter substrate-binding protein n=1 Tax=Herbiconiux moechotypicola TaxID=637393 RepID=A0ABP5Q8T8_9MICO|nr:BMP family ABC transporter substrate-binding protein [Herbiconiux moechotypicola]MCS5729329.1 BMP family ABC transporter substrate-binding protein [Herbiconiux moechotypicola]